MKTLALVIASVFNLLALEIACAHGDHPSTHGGTVGRGNDEIVVEFVMEKGTLNLYVDDEAGKPLATENLTGTLTAYFSAASRKGGEVGPCGRPQVYGARHRAGSGGQVESSHHASQRRGARVGRIIQPSKARLA